MKRARRGPVRLEKASGRLAFAAVGWCLLTVTSGGGALAQEPTPAELPAIHRIPHLEAMIAVDGRLDEPAWSDAWTFELGYEVEPGENTPAPVRTEVLLFHDAGHLYVGFRAWDPDPSAIRAHLSDRDEAWPDDWVGVVLDTFNDERRDYLFVVNPLGVQMDEIENWPGGQTEWDGIWSSSASIQDWGWSAELSIPFSTLRFQRGGGPQTWGFDAIRGYSRDTFRMMGTFPRDRSNNCYLCQSVKITGFENASPGRNLELVPTLTASRTDRRDDFPAGDLEEGDPEVELGVTARWGFTPNLTLSAALNPDFSQVEADARQLDINQPFALFYPEKRPFFMEGADFFATPMDAVYTRVMWDPDWGLKLTGKQGPHTIGAYVVRDEVTNILIPGSQSSSAASLEQSNISAVLRYKHDVGNRHTLGLLVTDREGDGYHNRVAGLDADLRLSDRDRLVFQVLGSSTRYPSQVAADFSQPSGDFEDLAAEVVYEHETRTLSWWGVLADVGEDFRADLGFKPRVDYRFGEAGIGYTWNATESSWYSLIDLKAKQTYSEDQAGSLLEQETAVQLTVQGPIESHAVVRPSHHREGFAGEEFEFNRLLLHLCLNPNRHSDAWANLTFGGQVDYDNVQQGDFINLDLGLAYRLGRHFRIDLQDIYETMDVDAGWLYDANIAQLTATWHFTARTLVRAITQHVAYDWNTTLYTDGREARFEQLFGQLLFSYKVNPRTVVFLGYSDNGYGASSYDLTRADRTLFAKIGYAWVP